MQLELERVKVICFDVDGTLCDTDDAWVHSIERILQPFRFLFPNKKVKPFARWIVMSIETPANLFYHLIDRVHLDSLMAYIFNHLSKIDIGRKPKEPLIIPGVFDMLHLLKDRYVLVIVSSGGERRTMNFLRHYEIDKLFDIVVTSQTCKYTKPFPDPIYWVAEKVNIPANNFLMIGDTVPDMRAGKGAGSQTIGVLCGFGKIKELERAGADLVIPNTADLVSILGVDK